MSSPYSVQIHQNTKEPSIGSAYSHSSDSYASSGSSTPRSVSPGTYREHGAGEFLLHLSSRLAPLTTSPAKHASHVSSSGRNLVINHHKVVYDANSPQVPYGNSYPTSRP